MCEIEQHPYILKKIASITEIEIISQMFNGQLRCT